MKKLRMSLAKDISLPPSPGTPQTTAKKSPAPWKTVVLLYFSFTLFRFLLALLIVEPVVLPDELVYKSMAYGFYKWLDFFALGPETTGVPTNIGYVFYQLVLSPIFFFKGYFFFAAKLLNAVVVNTAIFPVYGILRDFIPDKEAAAAAALPLLLPSFGYSTFFMAENIYIPLCAFFLYSVYKTWSAGRLSFSGLSALLLISLLLTKPHALTLAAAAAVCGVFLSLFFLFRTKDKPLGRKILISLGLLLSILFLCAAFFFWFSRNSFFRILGFITAAAQNVAGGSAGILMKGSFDTFKFLRMTAAHIGGLFILLLFPFLVSVWAWIDAVRTKSTKRLVLLTFGLFVFLEFFTLVLAVSVYFSPEDSFVRLHGRFYSVFFFFLLLSFAAFRKKMEWTRPRKITLAVLAFLTVLSLVSAASLYFRVPAKIMLPIDCPEMSWMAFCPPLVVVIVVLWFCFVTFRITVRENFKAYFAYFFVLAVLANSAQTRALMQTFQPQRLLTRTARAFVTGTIKDPDSRVAVFDREEQYGNLTVFWLPYTYTKVKFNFEDDVLRRQVIPADTEYAVLYGEFALDFSPAGKIREGRCTILFLAKPPGSQSE